MGSSPNEYDGPGVLGHVSASPNSNFVSAITMPRRAATAEAYSIQPQGTVPDAFGQPAGGLDVAAREPTGDVLDHAVEA